MEIPYEVTARRDTGLYNAKVGIWLFLASEVMLFGGLFSAYVFLRVGVIDGVDTPWPLGLNVHKSFIWIGFTNTIVLIASSVFVVFSWLALKERKWNVFRNWMIAVIACAAIFMVLKSVEYHSKLYKHHGIKLTDNSVMEGKIVNDTETIDFEVEKATINLQGGFPSFVSHIQPIESEDGDSFPDFVVEGAEVEGGGELVLKTKSELKKWFYSERRAVGRKLGEARSEYRKEKLTNPAATVAQVPTTAVLVAKTPFVIKPNNRKMPDYSADKVNYIDGVTIEGKLIRDAVEFEPHEVDLQLIRFANQDNALVWEVLSTGNGAEAAREHWLDLQRKHLEEFQKYFAKQNKEIPQNVYQNAYISLQPYHLGHGDHSSDEHKGEGDRDHGKKSAENPSADEKHSGDAKAGDDHGAGHAEHETVLVPREKIKFMGNHGPRYGNYYAIYFTMTALHGLHVIGGALVLAYFLIFGKKLYLKNPEHLANRVEVGGLFWHFVDLVWIFLFPIMYLL